MLGDLFIVLVFWVLFVAWLIYLADGRGSLKKHADGIRTATFFLVVMTLVYWLVLI